MVSILLLNVYVENFSIHFQESPSHNEFKEITDLEICLMQSLIFVLLMITPCSNDSINTFIIPFRMHYLNRNSNAPGDLSMTQFFSFAYAYFLFLVHGFIQDQCHSYSLQRYV